ncbi:MAG: molecular chaperone SurA [Rhizobacter sp.]
MTEATSFSLKSSMPTAMSTLLLVVGLFLLGNATAQSGGAANRQGDYIVAVVNQELVTAAEVDQRMAAARAANRGQTLPPVNELRQQALDSLIEERVLVTYARASGIKIEDSELERAVANVAAQNQLTGQQLRQRLQQEGIPYERFRSNLRDQLLVEKVREREVQGRVRISDSDVENWLETKRRELKGQTTLDIAQILVRVPDGASPSQVAERKARAEEALARLAAGESFEAVVKQYSDDATTKEQGGRLGARSIDRLPYLFVQAVANLNVGQRTQELLRSGAGFHILKVIERSDTTGFAVTQTRARHVLLRLSPQLSRDAVVRRLQGFKRQIESGRQSFEQLAKENSEDGSAAQGGDLGWASPGTFVPEFEQIMNTLPLGGISEPVVSRFGVHLIQVLERRNQALDVKQQRTLARNALREQKFEEAYVEWIAELRARAYIELRETIQ